MLWRLLQGILVVLVAASVAFVLLHAAPGDPFLSLTMDPGVTPEMHRQFLERYHLDQPLYVQYVSWLTQLARGEFGWSFAYEKNVSEVIAEFMPATLLLMTLAFASSIAFGILVGAWQGANAGSVGDRIVSGASFVIYAMPELWLALMLLLLLVPLGLPSGGMTDDMAAYGTTWTRIVDRIAHFILPWLALTLVGTALFARFQRASMRDTMREPFIANARARGLPTRDIRRHAWRASLTPVVTVAGLLFPALVTGAVFVERVFSWPGIGYAFVEGVDQRDYFLIVALVLVGSSATVIGNILADAVREMLDPRLRST